MTQQNRETLLALADRIEKATGPDRELDADIAVAVSGDPAALAVRPNSESIFSHKPGWWSDGANKSHFALAYTASIDAAMSLVLGIDWEWSLEWESGSLLYHPDVEQYARAKIGDPSLRMEAEAATPALALVAAALRASATLDPTGEKR